MSLAAGTRLGPYEIQSVIGAGGMGEVYKARDTRLDRSVAVKVLREAVASDPAHRRRFEQEARAVAALNHPHICTLYDIGRAGESDFLVMELLEGQTLKERLQGHPLSTLETVDLGLQLAEALEAAHAKGIFHRDIKPANVFISAHGAAKLLDFGLAKLALRPCEGLPEAPTVTGPLMTGAGLLLGTVGYMSPEQVRGEALDARTDLFALGVVLYEMATGQQPFRGTTPGAVLGEILTKAPASAVRLNADLPTEGERIVNKLLEKDRELRYQSAKDVRVDLERLRRSLAMPPVAAAHPAARRATRSRRASIRSIAVLPLANLSGDPQQEYFADGMTESLITDLGRLTGLKAVIARGSVMRYKNTQKPPSEIAHELNVDALITGAVLRSGNRVRVTAQLVQPESGEQLWTEHYEYELGDVLRLQNDVTRTIAGEIRVKLTASDQMRLTSGRSVKPQAYEANLMGRFHAYKMSREGLGKALEYFQLAIDRDPNYAPAHAGIGFAWQLLRHNSLASSSEAYAKGKAAAEKALQLDGALAEGHDTLAALLFAYEWDWASAEREYLRAIELGPNYANARCFYSLFLYAMRRPQEAKTQVERALELDPFNAFYHTARAVQLIQQRRADDALMLLQRAATLQPDSHYVHYVLWRAFDQKQEYEQALAEAKECFGLLKASDAVEALEVGYAQGGYHGAMRRAGDALAVKREGGAARPTDIAEMYLKAGDKDRAMEWLERAYEERASMLVYLNVHPGFDPLRSDPRFEDLVRRMKFPS